MSSVEVQLAKVRAAIDAAAFGVADQVANDMLNDNPWEWRAVWLSGLASLARG